MQPSEVNFKYHEDNILTDFKEYLEETYSEHYKSNQDNIECIDAWIALGDTTSTFRSTAIWYLWRYGKKQTSLSHKKDLFKALHYVLMMLHNDYYKE